MLRRWAIISVWAAACTLTYALEATGAPVAASGLLQFDPPQALGCVAVRVPVPEDQMITGLRWFNGTAQDAFPRILVASGNDELPPPYGQAVVVAENVHGVEQGWSEITFSMPVASQSGTLFVLLEYPADYVATPGEPALGVGYAADEAPLGYFVTGDGETWVKVISRCRVLLEPLLAARTSGVAEKQLTAGGSPPPARTEPGLFATPNPFNPKTTIDLVLPAAGRGEVRIFDVRGYLVATLQQGALAKGQNRFTWEGRNDAGQTVASGVYLVSAQMDDREYSCKVLLVR